MGMYTSFKIIAVIEKPYRQWFYNMIENSKYTEVDHTEIYKYIDHLYVNSGGFFKVQREYNKETGILICGGRMKDYGHLECDVGEIDHCIKNAILPFGELVKYYRHEDDHCVDCICEPVNISGDPWFTNTYKRHYIDKYKDIISRFSSNLKDNQSPTTNSTPLKDKMKEFLKKDIESMLERYKDYNFDLIKLKDALKEL